MIAWFVLWSLIVAKVSADTTCANDGVSLLQTHAKKKAELDEVDADAEEEEGNATEEWIGDGHFKRCWHVPNGATSGCRTGDGEVLFGGPKDNAARSPADCARLASEKGADTFDFQRGRKKCWLRKCGNTDLKVILPVPGTRIKPWLTYSKYCGWRTEKDVAVGCPRAPPMVKSVVQHFDPPSQETCTRHLVFNHMKNSNLNGHGPGAGSETLRFKAVLPDIDLVIRSDAGYIPANAQMNDVFRGKFGQINLRQGTTTKFHFMFVESRGQQRVVVPSFLFSIFDIDQGRNCRARTSISAQGYSAYYVEHAAANGQPQLDSEVVVDTQIEHDGGKVVTNFLSSKQGNKGDNPRNPITLTKQQARRTITLKYENVDTFELDLSIVGGNAKYGRNILFGGEANLNIVDNGNIVKLCNLGA